MFVHLVFFWLKPETTEARRRQVLEDCQRLLPQIPGVRHLWAGKPAMTPREVVDNSYDIGLCVTYDDKAGHDAYQDHPLHQEFLKRNKVIFDKIRVYDFA